MYKITEKVALNPTVTKMVIEAPLIAKKAKPGQFIIVRPFEDSERIPLTVAGYDREKGTVDIIFQIVGGTTMELNSLQVGQSVHDFVGPLGRATEVEGLKKVCVVGGGVGCAIALPIARELHEQGCVVHSVVGFRNKDLVILEKEFEAEKSRREKQIMQLEKEKLEYDLQHKSQEMANLMINFVRKNEMLTEIKSEIFKVASSLKGEGAREGKQLLLIINGKIDSNIQSDEVLKRIEDQFDLIHNNFMKRLHARHPDLSDNERMMCAYLKMNLSTKEIAPLLNISVRGVETIRYRLRKKFGLEREDSLTDYLNNKL